MSVSFACIMSKQADVGNVVRGFGLHFLLSSEESSTINPGSDDCISGTTLPPERLQLLRDISVILPMLVLCWHHRFLTAKTYWQEIIPIT